VDPIPTPEWILKNGEKWRKIRENSTYPHPEWISERVVSLLLSSLILLSSAIIVLLISVLISFRKSFNIAK
jgi:hypothetical protein